MKTELLIVLTDERGKAVPLARVPDSALLRTAAASVLRSKRQEAETLGRADPTLGVVCREELERLVRTFGYLIPDIPA